MENSKSSNNNQFNVEILEVKDELNPNYWKEVSHSAKSRFIDLDTTQLINARISIDVKLRSENAVSRKITASCAPENEGDPLVQRTLIYGDFSGAPGAVTPRLVLEFEQFNGREVFKTLIDNQDTVTRPYKCVLNIQSQVGTKSISNVEAQDLTVKVPFGFSALGAVSDNLDKKIQDARDSWVTETAIVLKDINNVLETIQTWMNLIVNPLIALINIINGVIVSSSAVQNTPFYFAASGVCGAGQLTNKGVTTFINYLQIPSQILSCAKIQEGSSLDSFLGPYAKWQRGVLETYNNWVTADFIVGDTHILNTISGNSPDKNPNKIQPPPQVKGLKDNLIISLIGLCVPGIIQNLEKAGQIQCRYVYCLENDVATGIPVDTCEQLRSQMTCKYVFGDLFLGNLPLITPLNLVGNMLKKILTDPIGVLLNLAWVVCTKECPVNGAGSVFCSTLSIVNLIGNQVFGIQGALAAKEGIENDYCSRIDVDKEEPAATPPAATPEPVPTPTPTPAPAQQ